MKWKLAVAAASVVAAGTALTASCSTNATAKVPIRTYTERSVLDAEGAGSQKWYSLITGSKQVVLSPQLAMTSIESNTFANGGGRGARAQQYAIVGKRFFTRGGVFAGDGDDEWSFMTLSASGLNSYRQELDPYVTLEKFKALQGIQQISATHYTVTGTVAQISPFTSWEFGLAAINWTVAGIKTVTVSFWLDSSGRPVKITAAGQSSFEIRTASETFGNYNKPLTITAPCQGTCA
jgi:hypothetical protein